MIEINEINLQTDKNLYFPDSNSALIYNHKIYITGQLLQEVFTRHYKKVISKKLITDAFHNANILYEDTDVKTKKVNGIRHYVISVDLLKLYIEMKKS